MVRRDTPFVFVTLLAAACSSGRPLAVPVMPPDALPGELAALEQETGHPWQARLHAQLGTPAFLEGRTTPVAATPDDAARAARAFVTAHQQLFSLTGDDFATVTSRTDGDGTTHTRFQQRNGRLAVWGSELLAHFDLDGALVRINGRYGPVLVPASTSPAIDADRARVVAALEAREQRPTAAPDDISTSEAELVLFPVETDLATGAPRPTRLAWRTTATVSAAPGARPLQLETIVDAEDAHVLLAIDHVETMEGTGVGIFGDRKPIVIEKKRVGFWLEDREHGGDAPSRTFSAGGKLALPGSEVRSHVADEWDTAPTSGTPGAAVDAHAHVAQAWDYFFREHGRQGFLDDGSGVRTTVHYGERYGGAFFDGTQLVFGDGNRLFTSPAASLDLVAHEYTHGIIANTSQLSPVGVSGAIDEGLADLFACLVSWDTGEGSRWQIGETVYHPRRRNQAIRDLADPHLTHQPAQLSEVTNDETHDNASIVGHLGYLLVEGGPLGPRALGPELTGRIFYRAMTTYLFTQAGWLELADALLAATRDVAPDCEPDVRTALVIIGIL
ncbi:MAG: M4 family metallopeptidase [Polyangia bacterium]